MATSKRWVALSALVGAGAALITTTLMENAEKNVPHAVRKQADSTSKYTQSQRPIIARASPGVQASSGRLEALEREVASLRSERSEPPASTSPTEIPSPPNPEEERRRVEAQFSELERQLQADPVDPSWSSGATESLRNDLSAVAREQGFDLVAVECRTDMCRATLRWNNYEAALRTGMLLPERAIPGLNCVKSIWLKEPDNPDGLYSSNLYLDCTEQRTGNVDIIPVTTTTTGELP